MAAKKRYRKFQSRQNERIVFFLMREKGPKFNPESVIREIYDVRDSIQIEHIFLKIVILWYVMLCYTILCYGKVCKIWYAMRFL